tara:strand:- start:102 stop:626 length:525 start_codon:yes stop_codon:yes gene_type:complete
MALPGQDKFLNSSKARKKSRSPGLNEQSKFLKRSKKIKVGESSSEKFIGRGRNKRKNPNYDPRMDAGTKQDLKKNPLKINNKGLTPNRKLAKGESKISESQMNKGKAPASANPEVKKKKARRNAAGTMGQMASGGKVKKMMGGGMAKKYKHGGSVKKCKVDGIARKGRTRAKRK